MRRLIIKTMLFSTPAAIGVFCILAAFGDWKRVLAGTAAGSAAATINFLLLALSVAKAPAKEIKAAKRMLRAGFAARMLLMAGAFLIAYRHLNANPAAFLLMMLLPGYAARLAGNKKWISG